MIYKAPKSQKESGHIERIREPLIAMYKLSKKMLWHKLSK